MKNIEVIQKENVQNYIQSLWKSESFKKGHYFIDLIINEVSKAPMFFYEQSHEREKFHLSALYRHIMHREYANDYIHDLYYFHELVHVATISYQSPDFEHWREKLSENELIASLYSEAFIYYFIPELLGKTFENLWVNRFIKKTDLPTFHLNIKLGNSNLLSLDLHNWPKEFQEIIIDRRRLRNTTVSQDREEAWIIKYNNIRESWLDKWKPYYENIDREMQKFLQLSATKPQIAIINLRNYLQTESRENVPFLDIITKKF